MSFTIDEPGHPQLGTFTASDGYTFFFRHFPTTGTPRGRVVFIHGIQSHGGWYPASCAKLAEEGFEVFFLDRRGSGQNMAKRGDIPSFRRVLDDFGEFLLSLPKDGLPKFLGAISWGGKFGVGMQYRFPGLVDGLMLLCPGIFSKVNPTFFERVRVFVARLVRPSRLFPIPLNDPAMFTSSPKWQKFLENDPLALRFATARLMFWSRALDIYLRRAWKRVKVPVLLLLAEKDQIIDNAKVRDYVEKFPSIDKTIIEYPGAYHTLEFEGTEHPFMGGMVSWLKRQTSK
ncbi:MAG: lysophospholipase [Planctomycetes bacterium]|nr:lysophospholipase [Planctomycetota bacterium]